MGEYCCSGGRRGGAALALTDRAGRLAFSTSANTPGRASTSAGAASSAGTAAGAGLRIAAATAWRRVLLSLLQLPGPHPEADGVTETFWSGW